MDLMIDAFVFRWLHVFFGIIWIGLLYYFNFVQVPSFAEMDASHRSGAVQKLVPRALWWFRYGALFTFLTGLAIFLHKYWTHISEGVFLTSAGGISIMFGALLGTLMFANVWHIIWPNQKKVIASAEAVAKGGQADPNVAAYGARALCASRTNTLFSIPMLFFMLSAAHLPYRGDEASTTLWPVVIVLLLVIFGFQLNAIKGKAAGPLASHQKVITSGFILWFVMYLGIKAVSLL